VRCRAKRDENDKQSRLLAFKIKTIESENYGDHFKYLRCNDIFSGWHLPGIFVRHQPQMVDAMK
jgi:hypothetical protein